MSRLIINPYAMFTPVQVSFLGQGAGAASGGGAGSVDVPYPASIAAGEFLLLHVVARDAASAAVTLPATWSSINTQNIGVTTHESRIMRKIAAGGESGSLTVTVNDSVNAFGRMYRLSAARTTESPVGQTNTGSSATMPCSDVTSTLALSLAIQAFWAQVNTTIGNVSGESGGDYTEAVAEYAQPNSIMSLQIATLASAGSITGGSATLGAAGTNRITHGCVINA